MRATWCSNTEISKYQCIINRGLKNDTGPFFTVDKIPIACCWGKYGNVSSIQCTNTCGTWCARLLRSASSCASPRSGSFVCCLACSRMTKHTAHTSMDSSLAYAKSFSHNTVFCACCEFIKRYSNALVCGDRLSAANTCRRHSRSYQLAQFFKS